MSQIPSISTLDGTFLSSSSEYSPKEESSQLTLLSSTITFPSPTQQQQQNSFSTINSSTLSNLSGTIDSINDKTPNIPRAVGSVQNNEYSNICMDLIKSPLNNVQISSEQKKCLLNESRDEVNLSSLLYLQTKERRIFHRRNKSEPVINGILEDLSLSRRTTILESSSTSTTSNESAISIQTPSKNKRKSSKISPTCPSMNVKPREEKSLSSSSSTTKKKKAWYNVSFFSITRVI